MADAVEWSHKRHQLFQQACGETETWKWMLCAGLAGVTEGWNDAWISNLYEMQQIVLLKL